MVLTKKQYSIIFDIFEPTDTSNMSADQVKTLVKKFLDKYNYCGSRSNFITFFNAVLAIMIIMII
jgi:hypothetical protein